MLKALQAVSRGEKVGPFWKEMIVKTFKLLAAEDEKQRRKRPYAASGKKGSQAKVGYTVDFQKKEMIKKRQKAGEEIIDRSMSKVKFCKKLYTLQILLCCTLKYDSEALQTFVVTFGL